ncbi:hypothetical protein M409DRAFT_53914 [Zasmidium cellare ATCC 36951]|uniref:Uncharacterized protein n=1 Tax=Zasmidium cellare ATCC 36951 TaxID=1080233 RepID=A0A6A6CL48_ZASCE|nr:uncharacterized protein M409DRAFT_53914 [Zasmidium cellare ATCC 36951]KAF2167977.1 hypothetical protein M409DRAFT_53914 [Zasmidium cellare ATCC 36951]
MAWNVSQFPRCGAIVCDGASVCGNLGLTWLCRDERETGGNKDGLSNSSAVTNMTNGVVAAASCSVNLPFSLQGIGSSRGQQLLSPFDLGPEDELSAAQRRGSLVGRVQSYSRIMHSYTMLQMQSSPGTTLPGYQKAMYEFTQRQMKGQRSPYKARSETSSPHIAAQQAVLPCHVGAGLAQLSLDDAPPPPCSTPEQSLPSRRQRGVKPRSTTEPIPRDFAVGIKGRAGVAFATQVPSQRRTEPHNLRHGGVPGDQTLQDPARLLEAQAKARYARPNNESPSRATKPHLPRDPTSGPVLWHRAVLHQDEAAAAATIEADQGRDRLHILRQ